MTTEVTTSATTVSGNDAWEGFVTGPWTEDIDVRDFIQRNYTPYDGDASFLAGATDKTLRLWDTLEKDYLSEERKGPHPRRRHPYSRRHRRVPGRLHQRGR